MPIVKMPDGTQVSFPDDMPPEQIKALILRKFPQLAQGTGTPAPQQPNPIAANASQGLSGVNEGIADTLGTPVQMTDEALRAGAAGLHALGGPNIQFPTDPVGGQQFFRNLMSPTIGAPTSDPTGQFVRKMGNDIGASILPGMGAAAASSRPLASMLLNTASSLASGGGGAAAGAAANVVAPGNQGAQNIAQAVGEGLGMATPGAASRLVTPFPVAQDAVSQARLASARALQGQGVDLTAGQVTGNKPLQYAESELGGGAELTNQQKQQFTQAALRAAGVNAPLATPDVMNTAFSDIGGRFNQLGMSTGITPDRQLGSDLSSVVQNYQGVVSQSNQAPIVQNTVADIVRYAGTGQITGQQYQDLRSRLGQAVGATDGPLNGALKGIQSALDDSLGRTLAAQNPSALQDWQQTRQDYANLSRIKEAVTGPGQDAADGIISPQRLRTVVSAANPSAYVRGNGQMGNLARAGVSGMTPLPNSGTSPRMAVHAIPTAIGAALGGMLGSNAGGPMEGGLAGAAAGAMAPAVLGKALMSRPVQGYLGNQVMANQQPIQNGFIGPLSAALIQQAGAQ